MTPRLLAALSAAVLTTGAVAQNAPPAGAVPPAAAPAQPAPASAGGNAKAIDKAKSLGKLGVQKLAPKLGRAEKLVRKADPVVDRAVDLAAEKVGAAPRR